jgi:ribulose-5-phosphate 4-epimerase/fuculose-1-phosphate aldolase
MLVNSKAFGASLASTLCTPHTHEEEETGEIESKEPPKTAQDHNVVLMTNHGFTAVGTSIKQAVYRAIYTHVNAGIQTNAIILRNAASVSNFGRGGLKFLNEEQVQGSLKMNDASQDRPWELWVREVEVCPLYRRQDGN